MKLSQQSLSTIEATIRKALSKYVISASEEPSIVTDFHLQPNPTSGELVIMDDDDIELASVTISEWISYDADDFDQEVEKSLSSVLNRMKNGGAFDHLNVIEPYSFVLIDENKETIAELLLLDSDTLIVNGELLKGLDKDLDDFLKNLLEK